MLRKRILAPTMLIVLVCASMLAPGFVLAGDAAGGAPDVEVGKKALIKTRTIEVEGTISSLANDTIEVSTDGGLRSVPRKEITSLDILVGKKNHALLGGLIGGGAGLLVGAVKPKGTVTTTCNYTYDRYGNRSGDCSSEGGSSRAVMIVGGTAVGALAGGIVGRLIRTDKWRSASSQVKVEVVPDTRHGVRFALSVSF